MSPHLPPPLLAFPGLGFLEDVVGGAVGGIADDITSTITGWMLSSAFTVFGFAIDVAFSNDGIIAGCNAENVEECSRGSFIAETFQRSLTASAGIAMIAFLFAAAKTVLQGDPGQLFRKLLFDAPRIILTSVFMLQLTIMIMLATDEVSAYLSHPALGPARDEYLGSFNAQELTDNPGTLQNVSFVVAVLGLLLTVGSVILWIVMMLRSVIIAILIALAPLIAALAIGGNSDGWGRLLKLLFAIITSKVVIIVTLSLGIAAMLQVPFIQLGLSPDAVVAAPPAVPGDEPGVAEAAEAIAANFEIAYQLATGALITFAAAFTPFMIMQLLPDSLEQYYAFGSGHRISTTTGQRAGNTAIGQGRRLNEANNRRASRERNARIPAPRPGTRVGK